MISILNQRIHWTYLMLIPSHSTVQCSVSNYQSFKRNFCSPVQLSPSDVCTNRVPSVGYQSSSRVSMWSTARANSLVAHAGFGSRIADCMFMPAFAGSSLSRSLLESARERCWAPSVRRSTTLSFGSRISSTQRSARLTSSQASSCFTSNLGWETTKTSLLTQSQKIRYYSRHAIWSWLMHENLRWFLLTTLENSQNHWS